MENCKEKIFSIIKQNSLSVGEFDLWEKMLKNLPENLCNDILLFLETEPNGVRILTDNLKSKVEAVKNQDLAKWEEILKQDEAQIRSNN